MLVSPLRLSFLEKYSLSTSSLGCKSLCMVMSFLFCSPFVKVLLSSTLRMVPSILRWYLFFLWDFCYVVWFHVVFSLYWGILLWYFLSSPIVWLCPLPIFPSICTFPFLWAFRFFLDLIVLFLPSFAIVRISLWAWNIFPWQIPLLYFHCISSLPV